MAHIRLSIHVDIEDLEPSRVQQFEQAEAENRITLRTLRRVAGTMGCDVVYAFVPRNGSFAELAEQPTRERASRDVKSVVHTMALENQKPENPSKLVEDEAQRRLNRRKHDELHPQSKILGRKYTDSPGRSGTTHSENQHPSRAERIRDGEHSIESQSCMPAVEQAGNLESPLNFPLSRSFHAF